MTLINDPNSDARSLMNRKPCICNGEKTGIQCAHFWSVIQKFPAQNAEAVRDGDKRRACTMAPSFLFEFTDVEKPTRCNRYEPRKEPGLVAIGKRALAEAFGLKQGPGYVVFDEDFERFNPVTLEEIEKLREEFPDKPVHDPFMRGKNPLGMSVKDIIEGEQIGILKPGEKLPGTLSEETKAAVDGIFGDASGIDEKKKT